MKHRFFGGIHPADRKEATKDKAIVPLSPQPIQVVIPMAMHLGAPCKPTVAKGDLVAVGQPIGEVTGLGAPVHASISGKVVAVEPRPHAGGDVALSVVIENDYQDTPHSSIQPRQGVESLSGAEIIEIVKEAGVTGLGGASFPTHVKLSGAVGTVDTIILNGAECEPYITANHRLMLDRGEAVLGGTRLIMQAIGLKTATIGIEANKLDAVEHLQSLLPQGETGIKLEVLKTQYPQGAEKQLIQRVTGRQVPPGGLPSHVGCCVFNIDTAVSIYEAVVEGKPLTHRNITVTGGALEAPLNVSAPIGTPVELLIQMAKGFAVEPKRLLMGGPMMGNALYDLAVPVQKGTNCILALTKKEAARDEEGQNCIRCARCVGVCPMRLTPLYMHMYAKKHDWATVEKYNLMDCMECGSCNYICPAGIHLVQSFRMAKFELRAMMAREKAKEAKA